MSTRLGSDDTRLIGRAHELEQVAALLAALPAGGRVLHLSGAPGTGRSAVLRYAARTAADQGVRVLTASWAPAEQDIPHAALHTLLRPHPAPPRTLPQADRDTLEAAFGGDRPPAPDRLAAAVLALVAQAPGPALVCVDDLDRIDAESRAAVREMARLCAGTRVGMIVAERTAPDAPLAPDALAVTLGPLSDPEARALVEHAGRATGYTETELVVAVAGGNPLALTELSLGDGAPGDTAGLGLLPATPRMAQAYAQDLAELPEPARRALLSAALSTSSLTWDVLGATRHVLGSGDAARAGLTEAVRRGLLAEDGRYLRFPRPLVRPAVLYLESAARRMAAHAALGRSVTSPPHAAWHAAQCAVGTDEDLAARLEELAALASSGTAVLTALAALENAARLSPDPARRAARLLRATELACDHGLREQALRLARGIDPAGLGTYGRALLLWVHELLPGNFVAGRESVAGLCAAARAVAATDPELSRKLLHAAARRCWWHQAGPDERRLLADTVEDLRPRPWDARDIAVMALVEPQAVPDEDTHRVLRRPGGTDVGLLGQLAHLVGDLGRATLLFREAERTARAEGRHGRLPQILVPRALEEIWLGAQWHTARDLADEGRTIAARTGQTDWVARATGALGVVAALRGEHERALECAAEVEEASLRLGQSRQLSLASLARALTASGTGRYAEAYAQLRSMVTEPSAPYSYEQFWGLAFLAEAAPPTGEQDDARAVVAQVEAVTRTGRTPLLRRILAYADALLGPDEEAAEHRYREALRPGIETWPLLHGMTLFGHGAWLRRRRRVIESREPLAEAESLFRTLGAQPRAELAATELRAAGQPAAEPDTGDVSRVLSPQQLTIARLAARGLSNRAIGEQLRLSPRTVASHLYQIFPKLGVTSRAQLATRIGTD
ncbi:AAA family ATPase [Streptomyces sp. NPDC058319]|uniref:AAA family ATPase n=1 Tax=unclassified Streptomyces TaxID=2593676 RepID=UPI0036EA347A